MPEYSLKTPLSEGEVRKLQVGDVVWITGRIHTARDMAHKYLVGEKPDAVPLKLEGGVVYHCGPVVKKEHEWWTMVSCGPTTSAREEPYEAAVIERYGVRAVVGKGGMGSKTLDALQKHCCVYLAAVGGTGAVLADTVKNVAGVYMLEEFGVPEAVWILEVEKFGPLTVAMDSYGESLYRRVEKESRINLWKMRSTLK